MYERLLVDIFNLVDDLVLRDTEWLLQRLSGHGHVLPPLGGAGDCPTIWRRTETFCGQARKLCDSTLVTAARWTSSKNLRFVAALLVVAWTAMGSDAFEQRCVRAAEDSGVDSIQQRRVATTTMSPTTGIRRCNPMKLHSVWLLILCKTVEVLQGFLGLMLLKSSFGLDQKLARLFRSR